MSRWKVVLITWVSASGKTSLQDELLKRGWKRPLNFSTRKPRTTIEIDEDWDYISKEMEEYIFLNRNNFSKKFANGDFLEAVRYWDNLYGISNHFPDWDLAIIVEPSGRAQALQYLLQRGFDVRSYYIEITPELQELRLRSRGDNEEEIYRRKNDYLYFYPTPKCVRLNGAKDTNELADIIEWV